MSEMDDFSQLNNKTSGWLNRFSPDLFITYAAIRAYVGTLRPIAELLS